MTRPTGGRDMRRGVGVKAAAHAAVVSLTVVLATVAQAGEQADRAVAAVKQLIARGEVKPDAVLKMRAKQGNMVSFLGRDYELQKDWERQTGILVDASV